MIALPWLYLVLLSIGYVLALTYGQLGMLAAVSVAMLLIAGYAVRQQRSPWARYLGHGLFVVLARAWRCTGCRVSTTAAASRPSA